MYQDSLLLAFATFNCLPYRDILYGVHNSPDNDTPSHQTRSYPRQDSARVTFAFVYCILNVIDIVEIIIIDGPNVKRIFQFLSTVRMRLAKNSHIYASLIILKPNRSSKSMFARHDAFHA